MKRGGFTSGKRGGSVSGQRGSTSEIAGLVLLVVLVSTTVTFMVLVSHRLSDLSDWHIGRLAGPRSQASADTPLATPAAADTPAAAPPAADSLAKYSGSAKYLLEHEEPECAELIRQSSKIMFVMLGGRGYHDVRARTGLRSWARCVCHVMVLTDPSVDIAEYISPHRFVHIVSGDAWLRRPYLPMTHMDAIGKALKRPQSPAADVQWFFLVSDRSFVHVPRLLALARALLALARALVALVALVARALLREGAVICSLVITPTTGRCRACSRASRCCRRGARATTGRWRVRPRRSSHEGAALNLSLTLSLTLTCFCRRILWLISHCDAFSLKPAWSSG